MFPFMDDCRDLYLPLFLFIRSILFGLSCNLIKYSNILYNLNFFTNSATNILGSLFTMRYPNPGWSLLTIPWKCHYSLPEQLNAQPHIRDSVRIYRWPGLKQHAALASKISPNLITVHALFEKSIFLLQIIAKCIAMIFPNRGGLCVLNGAFA